MNFAFALEKAGPWGNAFPQPIFNGEFKLVKQSVVAQKHLRLELSALNSNQIYSAIAFNQEVLPYDFSGNLNVVYEANINRFRGTEKLQLLVRQIEMI